MKKILVLMAWLLSGMLVGCMGYVPGQQSYWDAQVRAMCEKDGGVKIFERITVSATQATTLPKVGPYFSISPRATAKSDAPAYWDESVKILHDANPRVWRSEQVIRRYGDEKIVARVVRYIRVGGDIPSPAHSSSFTCPDEVDVLAQREKVFVIQGEQE